MPSISVGGDNSGLKRLMELFRMQQQPQVQAQSANPFDMGNRTRQWQMPNQFNPFGGNQ
jgi:hypothetical protein